MPRSFLAFLHSFAYTFYMGGKYAL
ncbi:tetratricopeptide repeat protein [Anoxybacillus sp. MB8]